VHGLGPLYRLFMKEIVTPGKLLLFGVLGLVGVLVGLLQYDAGADDITDGVLFVNGFNLTLLVPVAALVLASATLGDPNEDRTLVYIWLSPVSRLTIAMAAWLAAITVVVPLVAIPSALTGYAGTRASEGVIGATVASGLGGLAYCGLFVAIGLRFKRSLLWGLVYILIWEGFVASIGGSVEKATVRAYTRSVLADITDIEIEGAPVGLGWALFALALVVVVSLGYTTWRLNRHDID
ncbi:MAG: hypothetical protein OES57_06400, partial [Acidimicrobiia bacterium]|nr:hypothetical protein [Acidimicrobiia bacterium]